MTKHLASGLKNELVHYFNLLYGQIGFLIQLNGYKK